MAQTYAQRMLGRLLPPELRRLRKQRESLARGGRENRKKPRITIHELNRMGVAALKQKGVTVEQIKRPDTRGGFEKVLDWLDLPRNMVAQIVGRIAGVDVSKIKERGALGLKRVYMSDVLKKAGVQNRAVRGVLGFVGDLAIDPLMYISAGALTGRKVAGFVPRVLKPGQRAVKAAAKTGRAPSLLREALGGQRTLRAIQAVKAKPGRLYNIMARNALRSDAIGDAARAWFQQHGLRGRALFRVPFTQVMGPVIPVGKRARAFRAMTLGAGEVQKMARLRSLRTLERTGLATRELTRRYKAALPAKRPEILRKLKPLRVQARELAEELGIEKFKRAPGRLGQLARAERIRLVAAPTAPRVLRMAAKETARGMHLHELNILHRMGLGASAAAQRGFRAVRPEIDRVAGIVAKDLGKKTPEIRTAIYNIIDVGGKRGIGRFMQTVDEAVRQWPQLAPIAEHKATRGFMARFYRTMRGVRAEELKRGIQVGREVAYMPRPLTREAARLTRQYEAAGARALRAGIAQPMAPRARLMPVFSKAGEQIDTILSTSLKPKTMMVAGKRVRSLVPRDPELATQWAKAGWRVTEEAYPVSALELAKRAREGRLAGILGPGVRPKAFIEMDPAVAAAQRASQHVRRMAFRDLELLVGKTGVPITSTAQLTPGMAIPVSRVGANHPLAGVLPSRIFGGQMSYPEPVAKMLDRMYKIWTPNSVELSNVVRASEFTLMWFKRWALFHPAYVIRNAFQNAYGTFMAGGNPIRSAQLAGGKDVATIFRAIETGAGDAVQQFLLATGQKGVPALTGTIKIAGKDVPLALLARDAAMYNFAGGARSAAEFAPTMLRAEGVARGAARGAVSAGQRFGDFVRVKNAALEGRMKIGAWINFMEKGMSPRQAAFQTLLAMPDLSDLPMWGRRYATRIFPWFRWAWRNGSLQLLHYLPEQPIHMASVGKLRKMFQDMSSMWRQGPPGDVPEDLRAEWMRESQAAQVAGTPDEGSAFLLRNWFPFEEVQSIAAGLADPAETMRWLYGSTRPGIKFGAEMATGHDIFRNRPVRPFTTQEALGMVPEAVLGRTGTPLDNLFAIRPLKEYGRRIWEQPTVPGAITRGFLGGAIQPISAERGLQEIGQRTAGQLAILRRKIVRALENRDEPEYNSLLRQFMEIQAQRVRYGLQVPRSTEAVMQGVQ